MKINMTEDSVVLLIIVVIAFFMFANPDGFSGDNIAKAKTSFEGNTVKIANWNLQIFGESKASDPELMAFYKQVMEQYDIIFIQEIRDISGEAWSDLCVSMKDDYQCAISSRAGKSSSKEQYGVLFRDGIDIVDFVDYNPSLTEFFERPPLAVRFEINNYTFIAYDIHVKPDDAVDEIDYLERMIDDRGNVLILGDLNADCDYYDRSAHENFKDWYWLITDDDDTTSTYTDCAYDRLIINSDLEEEYVAHGIYTPGITEEVSDHYLVWIEIGTPAN